MEIWRDTLYYSESKTEEATPMQFFTNDYKKELLFINKPVTFIETGTGNKIILKLPTLHDLYYREDLMTLISILEQNINDIGKMMPQVEINSHFDFIGLILALGQRRSELKELRDTLLSAFDFLLSKFTVEGNLIKFESGTYMIRELFDSIQEIILESTGREKPIIIKEEDDEFTRREKEAEMRVRKIKESARKSTKSEKDYFEDMLVTIIYEFPQYKLEDLFGMNMYTVTTLYKNAGKIANYEVMKIAAGNGLAKNFKYFTE